MPNRPTAPLAGPDAWLSAAFAERYGSIEIGRRGVVVPRVAPIISLEP